MSNETNDFRAWMDERGLKTKAVAAALHVDDATIRNWRSSGVPPRRLPHVLRYMEDWQENADLVTDEQINAFATTQQNLVLHPTEAEFEAWSLAALAKQKTLKAWALEGLNELAKI